MSAPASAVTQGPSLGASEGVHVAFAPGHERPLAHVLGAVEKAQPRPTRAGRPAGTAAPKVDPKQGLVPGLDLSIGKSHIGPFKQGEHSATYMITVGNDGSFPAGGFFSVTDYLPSSMTATAMSGVGWDCTLSTLTCGRISLLVPATQFPTIYLTVNVADDAPESVTNVATLTADVNEGPPVVTTATDPTRIISGDEDRGSGKGGGVNVKIDNHNVNIPVNLNVNHSSAHAGAHQAQAQSTSVKTKVHTTVHTKVHTKVNTKLHVHDTNVVVVGKSRHHHCDR